VLRGLHYHHHQVDYWMVLRGHIRVGLVDLRPASSTYRQAQTLEMGEEKPVGLLIPVGVAHGFLTLTDATLLYMVDNYYDGNDENGVAWDDPVLALEWGITTEPILSERDRQNPHLKDIPAAKLPPS
jgi:dTDP-4-dehydrorhamnose 3,5-epimerase